MPASEVLYKVLGDNGKPYLGAGKWPLPSPNKAGAAKVRPGKWVVVGGELVACQNGLHAATRDQLLGFLDYGLCIYELEYEGELLDAGEKVVVRKARLTRVLNWDAGLARLFACDCAERALERERSEGREPDERLWDAITVAREYVEGRATQDDLRSAWSAARSAERQWQTDRLFDYLEGRVS